MAKKPVTSNDDKIVVTDPGNAPIIFFDGVPNFGTANGIVNITLAANRHMLQGDSVETDVIATAFLRCNVQAAMNLRDAIDKALLIGAPAADHQIN